MSHASLNDLKALDKDELISLLERSLFVFHATREDITSARWDVASKRAIAARQKASDLFQKSIDARDLAISGKRRSDLRTWTDLENRWAAADQAAAKAEKKADRLWKEMEGHWAKRRASEARAA